MAKLENLAPLILKWEGGYVNDPADRGGAERKAGASFLRLVDCRRSGGGTNVLSYKKQDSNKELVRMIQKIYLPVDFYF